MKIFLLILALLMGGVLFNLPINAQTNGDYRSAVTGSWTDASTWETYNGTAWVAAVNPPNGSENITVKDTVSVTSTAVAINGYLKAEVNGVLTVGELGSVTFASGSTYEHARNVGTIPMSTWEVGSTAKFTGVTSGAPGNRVQSFSKIIWDCPGQAANLNMGWNNVTISGDIIINSTGTGRWYFAGPTTGNSAIFTINGDIYHNAGNFATHGTGNGNTTIIVNHFGNITSSSGNFSIARGSQSGTGTTTWYLHGNLSLTNTETQNSNPAGAKFVFAGENHRTLILDGVTYGGGGLPLEVDSSTTVFLGNSVIGGNAIFSVNDYGGVITTHSDGLNGNITTIGTITLSNLGHYGFNGTSPQVTGALLPVSVNDLFINNSSGVTLSSNLQVNGTVTMGNGSIILGSNSFSYGTDATLHYRGTTTQTTSNVEFPATGGPLNLEIENSANVMLHAGRTLNGTVTILEGDLNLNGNTLTIGPSGFLIESPFHTVTGTSGKITTTRILSSPSGVNVGGLGAVITSTANLGSTLIERYHDVKLGGTGESISRNYNIIPANNTGLDATLRFYYDESELNSIPESNLKLFKSATGANNTWSYSGGVVNTEQNYVEQSGISSFSYWTLGDVNNPIPVELTSFSASVEKGLVLLNWTTATENQNRGWDVEKAIGKDWTKIGFVEGAGTTTEPLTYSFTDGITSAGKVEYRLKQIDFDGTYSYSSAVSVEIDATPEEFSLQQNYPNPFNPETTIKFELPYTSFVNLSIYNLIGEKVATLVNEQLEQGVHFINFKGNNLASGLYVYRLSAGEVSFTKTMMLLK